MQVHVIHYKGTTRDQYPDEDLVGMACLKCGGPTAWIQGSHEPRRNFFTRKDTPTRESYKCLNCEHSGYAARG